jgi:hypothetical protein
VGTVYSRSVPIDIEPEALARTVQHVRDTIRSMVSETDDPTEHIPLEVTIEEDGPDRKKIVGYAALDPVASYLRPDFDPDKDAYEDNPLHATVDPTHLLEER